MITLTSDGQEQSCDVYSEEGFALLAALWLKLSAQYRCMYEPRWLGVPIIQLPEDIVISQELIWKDQPMVYMFHQVNVWGQRKSISGFEYRPNNQVYPGQVQKS